MGVEFFQPAERTVVPTAVEPQSCRSKSGLSAVFNLTRDQKFPHHKVHWFILMYKKRFFRGRGRNNI